MTDSNDRRSLGRILLGEELQEVESISVGFGTVVLFNARSPEKLDAKRNEDALGVFPIDEGAAVLAVADGCGGMPRGGVAADLAIETLQEILLAGQPTDGDAGNPLRPAILNAVELASARIKELGVGAATTLTVVEIRGNTARTYHIGDSGLLVVGNRGKIRFQTIAHSPVGYAVESGMLDESGAMRHEDRNLVSNLLGLDGMRIDVGPKIELQSRDTLVMGSDGLFDNLRQQEIVDLVRKGPLVRAARALRDACMRRMAAVELLTNPSKPDDLSFAVFRLDPAADWTRRSAG